MKNSLSTKKKLLFRHLLNEGKNNLSKRTDINILLNRVRSDKKKESKKKVIFSITILTFSVCFGALIF